MTLFKSKFMALALVAGATISLSACGSIPTCNDELDQCDRNGAYTEERTVQAGKRKPAPEPTVIIEEKIVVIEKPVMVPAPVADAPIMQSAEPQFTQISK